jgi:hypothetical protein
VQTTAEYVTIPEAARRLGLSKSAVRRRLQSGQLAGRREERPQGHVWLIALPNGSSNGHANGAVHPSEGAPAGTGTSRAVPKGTDTSRQVPAGAAAGAGAGTALQRAQEMAAYSEALLAPYVRRIEERAERIGRLEERAEHLQAELAHRDAELERVRREAKLARQEADETARLAKEAATLREATAEEQRRPWWRFW